MSRRKNAKTPGIRGVRFTIKESRNPPLQIKNRGHLKKKEKDMHAADRRGKTEETTSADARFAIDIPAPKQLAQIRPTRDKKKEEVERT